MTYTFGDFSNTPSDTSTVPVWRIAMFDYNSAEIVQLGSARRT
ncbi:MAG: hypothetical protein ACJ8CR_04440 [Roseiflexaceae bacterium]